jgi:diguanylate cyclase (GGDEF)-like protein
VAALVLGSALTAGSYRYADERSRDHAASKFDDAVDRQRVAIETELRADLDKLRDVGAFVVAEDEPPSPEAFAAYVKRAGVFERFESLLGMIVIERVEPDQLDAFVARQRTVRPDFAVVPVGTAPEGSPHYIVTYYQTGSIDFTLPPGLDVTGLESVRGELENRGARAEAGAGAIQNDPIVRQLSGADPRLQQFDFLMGVPIWPPGHEAGDGSMPTMWVSAPIGRFDDILRRSLAGQPNDLGVRLTVNIERTNLSEAVRRVSEQKDPPGPLDQAAFSRDVEFTTDGISWSMTAWSGPDPMAETGDATPALVLVVGLAATVLAGFGVYLRARSRTRERRLVELQVAHDRIAIQRDVLTSVREAVVVVDPADRIVTANPGWEKLRSRPDPADDATTPDEGADYLQIIGDVAVTDTSELALAMDAVRYDRVPRADVEIAIETDGLRWWSAVRITPLHSEPGGLVLVHRDVTEQRRSMAALKLQATHDPLTGLLNRGALEEETRARIDRVRESNGLVGALFVDLDDFKVVNDVHGHGVGDEVLSVVAERILGATRGTDIVARQGGDEFVVVLEPLSSRQSANDLAQRLLDLIAAPIATEGVTLSVKASIGVVVLDGASDASLAGLLRQADNAMYESKQSGGATFTVAVN